jgi:hypothetical protein
MDIGVDGERHKVAEAVHSAAQEIKAQETGRGRRRRRRRRRGGKGAALKEKEKKLGFFFFFFLSVFTIRHLGSC